MTRSPLAPGLLLAPLLVALACRSGTPTVPPAPDVVLPKVDFSAREDGTSWKYTEARAPCSAHLATRQVLFGDLHSHTAFSFDAWAYGTRATPADAYRFAQGQPISPSGEGAPVQLERPLDFASVSDHAEFLGEIARCTTPGGPGYDGELCQAYRANPESGVTRFGSQCADADPHRMDLCPDAGDCVSPAAREVWQKVQQAAEDAYDRTAACRFTAFVAYEYTSTQDIDNRHRLVLFRNGVVPAVPASHYEAPTEWHLWASLLNECLIPDSGCDVLTEAHNTNLASGAMFGPDPRDSSRTPDEKRYRARVRAYLEPILEVFQHKGASECRAGLGTTGADAACEFEQQWPPDAADCGDRIGTFGMRLAGCTSRFDYARGILLEGQGRWPSLGLNPFALGIMASSDTHNATPGRVDEWCYQGHVGTVDDTPQKRLSKGNVTHDTYINNPGGLVAVWAEENSRDAVFSALRRREIYGTSGPRIKARFFGGWSYATSLAPDAGWEATAYAQGVPMGGVLGAGSAGQSPVFLVWAKADAGTTLSPGNRLEQAQIVKGWIGSDGQPHEQVYAVARTSADTRFDPSQCGPNLAGDTGLWKVWTDPSFDPAAPAFWYLRVLESPTCRWSTWECARFASADRPAQCDLLAKTVQERAWTSPIWYYPAAK